MDSYINIIGNVSMFILLIFVIFCLKKSWESEKKIELTEKRKLKICTMKLWE